MHTAYHIVTLERRWQEKKNAFNFRRAFTYRILLSHTCIQQHTPGIRSGYVYKRVETKKERKETSQQVVVRWEGREGGREGGGRGLLLHHPPPPITSFFFRNTSAKQHKMPFSRTVGYHHHSVQSSVFLAFPFLSKPSSSLVAFSAMNLTKSSSSRPPLYVSGLEPAGTQYRVGKPRTSKPVGRSREECGYPTNIGITSIAYRWRY